MENSTLAPGSVTLNPGSITIDTPDRKKKKKKKYTRGLGDVQRMDRGFAKAARRVNKAVVAGLDTYLKESDKSARKRRDGAIMDAFENWSEALGKTMRRASEAPAMVASAMNTRWSRGNSGPWSG